MTPPEMAISERGERQIAPWREGLRPPIEDICKDAIADRLRLVAAARDLDPIVDVDEASDRDEARHRQRTGYPIEDFRRESVVWCRAIVDDAEREPAVDRSARIGQRGYRKGIAIHDRRNLGGAQPRIAGGEHDRTVERYRPDGAVIGRRAPGSDARAGTLIEHVGVVGRVTGARRLHPAGIARNARCIGSDDEALVAPDVWRVDRDAAAIIAELLAPHR